MDTPSSLNNDALSKLAVCSRLEILAQRTDVLKLDTQIIYSEKTVLGVNALQNVMKDDSVRRWESKLREAG